jgi:plastocyanin
MPAATVASDRDIRLEPCAFSPTITNVAVGATVTFHNGPGLTHLITGANQAWGSRDVEVQPNKTVAAEAPTRCPKCKARGFDKPARAYNRKTKR